MLQEKENSGPEALIQVGRTEKLAGKAFPNHVFAFFALLLAAFIQGFFAGSCSFWSRF